MGGVAVSMKKRPQAHVIYDVCLVLCYYVTFLCVFMDYLQKTEDLKESMKNVRILFAMVYISWIHLSLRFNKAKIEHLLKFTEAFIWEDMPATDADNGRATMAGRIQIVQTAMKYVTIFMFVFHGVQSSVHMWKDHDMVFATWYPFDVSNSPVYEIINLTQFTAFVLVTSVFASFQGLYATLVCVACSQLEKLRANLSRIGEVCATPEQGCGHKVESDTGPEEKQKQQLEDCICHHQITALYMQELEKSLNTSLAGLFFCLLAAMCLVSFSAVTSWGDHNDVSQAMVMCVLMMANVFVFCWLGNELSEQAERVRNAVWDSNWIGTPVPFQRCLVFIIASANKEVTLTAGKFVPMSNKTTLNMMNHTISFFMFLLHMKKKNEETKQSV